MPKALVVDDEQDIRGLLVDTLVDAGYDVIEAGDGHSAYEQACNEYPDVILLDVWIPNMDGFEVLEKLRENPITADVPVILLTAMSAVEGEPAANQLAVPYYITKPFDPRMVEAAVKVALSESGASIDAMDEGPSTPVWAQVRRGREPTSRAVRDSSDRDKS